MRNLGIAILGIVVAAALAVPAAAVETSVEETDSDCDGNAVDRVCVDVSVSITQLTCSVANDGDSFHCTWDVNCEAAASEAVLPGEMEVECRGIPLHDEPPETCSWVTPDGCKVSLEADGETLPPNYCPTDGYTAEGEVEATATTAGGGQATASATDKHTRDPC